MRLSLSGCRRRTSVGKPRRELRDKAGGERQEEEHMARVVVELMAMREERDEQRSSIDCVLPSGYVVGLHKCALGVSLQLTVSYNLTLKWGCHGLHAQV